MKQEDLKRMIAEELKTIRSSTPVVEEQEVLEEAVVMGALLGKLLMLLMQKENIRKVTSALLSRRDEIPESAVKILEKVEELLEVVEENVPDAVEAMTDRAGRWAPTSWGTNLLVAIFSHFVKKKEPKETKPEEIAVAN